MGIESYFLAAGANTALFPEGMSPSNVNDGMRAVQSDLRTWYSDPIWIQYGKGDGSYTAAYASAGSFTIASADVTAAYHANRRVKITGTATGTVYGTIASSSYSDPNTTVVVTLDSGALESESLTVWLSSVPATNSPLPATVLDALASVTDFDAAFTVESDHVLFNRPMQIESGGKKFRIWTSDGVLRISDATVDPFVNMVIYNALAATPEWLVQVPAKFSDTVEIDGEEVTAVATSPFASEAEADAGTSNTVVMSPLRVQNAIAHYPVAIGYRTERTTLELTDMLAVGVPDADPDLGLMRKSSLATMKDFFGEPDFESLDNALASFPVTVAHGLGATPKRVEAVIRVTTTHNGHTVGAEFNVMTQDTDASSRTATIGRDASDIWVGLASDMAFRRKTDNVAAALTYANCVIDIRAWE